MNEALKEQLKKDEVTLMEKLEKSLANRESANDKVRDAGDAMIESRAKLGEEMEAVREQLRPYLDGRKKMDPEAVKLAHRYSRMVRDLRMLTKGPDICSEVEAGADLGEIGPISDGKSAYRNLT